MYSEPKTQEGMARRRVDAVSRAQLITQDDAYNANTTRVHKRCVCVVMVVMKGRHYV